MCCVDVCPFFGTLETGIWNLYWGPPIPALDSWKLVLWRPVRKLGFWFLDLDLTRNSVKCRRLLRNVAREDLRSFYNIVSSTGFAAPSL